MKPFIDEEFLLSTPTAQKLYHDFAETMPILDYHCRINPEEIAKDDLFRKYYPGIAGRRSLQMETDAFKRCG